MKRAFSQFYHHNVKETLHEYYVANDDDDHDMMMYRDEQNSCVTINKNNNNYCYSSEEENEYSPSNKKKKTSLDHNPIIMNNNIVNNNSMNQSIHHQNNDVILTANNNKEQTSLYIQSILQGQYLVDQNNEIARRIALSIVNSEQHEGLFNFEIVEWSLLQEEGRSKLDVLSGIIQVNGDNRIGMVSHKKSVFKSLISGPEQYWKCEEVLFSEYQPVSALWKGSQFELKIMLRGTEYSFSKR